MGLGCGTTMVKYILFVFNFLIALGGIALVTIGSIILAKSGDLNNAWQDGQNPSGAAIALIIFGGIVFLISFFGCCGAIRESYCMTMTYATILFMIFVAQLVVAILVLVYKQDFKDEIMAHIGKIWAKPEENREAIQGIQKTFNCCGWGELSWGGIVSKFECAATGNIVENDCKALLSDFLSNSGNLLAWVAIGVAGVELVALIFACCLGNNVRNAQRRYA